MFLGNTHPLITKQQELEIHDWLTRVAMIGKLYQEKVLTTDTVNARQEQAKDVYLDPIFLSYTITNQHILWRMLC